MTGSGDYFTFGILCCVTSVWTYSHTYVMCVLQIQAAHAHVIIWLLAEEENRSSLPAAFYTSTNGFILPCALLAPCLQTAEKNGCPPFTCWVLFKGFWSLLPVFHPLNFIVFLSIFPTLYCLFFALHFSWSISSVLISYLSSSILGEICFAALSILAFQLNQDVFAFQKPPFSSLFLPSE